MRIHTGEEKEQVEMKKRVLAILAYFVVGFIGAAAYPPVSGNWPLIAIAAQSLWFSYMLFMIEDAKSAKAAFIRAWGLGVLKYSISLSWILYVFQFWGEQVESFGPFVFLGLCIFLALFIGVVGATTHKAPTPKRYIAFAIIFTLVEWSRNWAFSGFPWNPASLVWSGWAVMYQTVSLFGTFGLTFVTVLTLTTPYLVYRQGKKFLKSRMCHAIAAVFFSTLAFGIYNVRRVEKLAGSSGFTVRLVNANFQQAQRGRVFDDIIEYIRLSRRRGWWDIDLFVWPESAIPKRFEVGGDIESILAGINNEKSHLVAGDDRIESLSDVEFNIYNSMVFINNGGVVEIYDKRQLVPFGEYMPGFMRILPYFEKFVAGPKDFSRGQRGMKVALGGGMVAYPLVCYEIVFPGLRLGRDVDFILNILNEEWFGELEKHQSLDISRLRAVEEGMSVVRVANLGFSAVISPTGRLVMGEKVFEDSRRGRADLLVDAAVLDVEVPNRVDPTLFSVTGNYPLVMLLSFWLLWIFWPTSAPDRGIKEGKGKKMKKRMLTKK